MTQETRQTHFLGSLWRVANTTTSATHSGQSTTERETLLWPCQEAGPRHQRLRASCFQLEIGPRFDAQRVGRKGPGMQKFSEEGRLQVKKSPKARLRTARTAKPQNFL